MTKYQQNLYRYVKDQLEMEGIVEFVPNNKKAFDVHVQTLKSGLDSRFGESRDFHDVRSRLLPYGMRILGDDFNSLPAFYYARPFSYLCTIFASAITNQCPWRQTDRIGAHDAHACLSLVLLENYVADCSLPSVLVREKECIEYLKTLRCPSDGRREIELDYVAKGTVSLSRLCMRIVRMSSDERLRVDLRQLLPSYNADMEYVLAQNDQNTRDCVHDNLVDVCIALFSIELPKYVILDISEFIPHFDRVSARTRFGVIERATKSSENVFSRRQNDKPTK